MVMHWWKNHEPHWQTKMLVNGLGAFVTGFALIVIAFSKFLQGAWISILLIPIIVTVFLRIRNHYTQVAKQLSLRGLPPSLKPLPEQRVVLPVSGVHRGVVEAVNFARSITSRITAVYIELNPGAGDKVRKEWGEWWPDIPIEIVPSPYRSMIGPLFEFLDRTDLEHNDGQSAILVMPEFIPAHWWQSFMHNQSAWFIRNACCSSGVVVRATSTLLLKFLTTSAISILSLLSVFRLI